MALPLLTAHLLLHDPKNAGVRNEIVGLTATVISG
jgi:hypothetical protein